MTRVTGGGFEYRVYRPAARIERAHETYLANLRRLEAGKSIRWVAGQLGHADPALTMRVYAHAMRGEESDLFFADFGSEAVTGRLDSSPVSEAWEG